VAIDGAGISCRKVRVPPLSFTKMIFVCCFKNKVLGKYYAQQLSQNETGKVDILVGALC
jgi:hypothetical protein